jgi:hypothetical protein
MSTEIINNKLVKQDDTSKPARDAKGRLLPGYTANPHGRPKGLSITALIKEKLKEIPPGQKISYLEAFIKTILHKALVDKDEGMIKAIWAYIDGMPKQKIDMDIEEEIREIKIEIVQKKLDIEIFNNNELKGDSNISKKLSGISETNQISSKSGREGIKQNLVNSSVIPVDFIKSK